MNNVSVIINNMSIRLRSDGRYEGRLTNDGVRKSFYGKTKSEVKNKAKEYLTKSGLKRLVQLFRPCFKKAVEEEIIYKNPCDNVILPKVSCIQTETKTQFSLTPQELELFQKTALSKYKTTNEYKSRDAIILLLMVNLGLRVGEVLALEWNDIDFENGIIYIKKTVQSNIENFDKLHGNNATYNRIKKSAKTNAGVRTLQLNDTVMCYLNELRKYDERNGSTPVYSI